MKKRTAYEVSQIVKFHERILETSRVRTSTVEAT